MSADKYPSIFSRQMEAIVYIFSPQMEAIVLIILQIFCATRAVLKIGECPRIFPSFSDSCDIGFRVQFNAEFPRQVMNFPILLYA